MERGRAKPKTYLDSWEAAEGTPCSDTCRVSHQEVLQEVGLRDTSFETDQLGTWHSSLLALGPWAGAFPLHPFVSSSVKWGSEHWVAKRKDPEEHSYSSPWWELLFLGDSAGRTQSLGGEALMAEPKASFESGCGYGFGRGCSALLDMGGLCPGTGISFSYL